MYLTHLSLTNFRSFSRLDMDVPRRVVLLVGSNAQGKTSILERTLDNLPALIGGENGSR